MTDEQKIKVLEQEGWHQYYSKTTYVHKDIFTFLQRDKVMYYGSDYTNHQYTLTEAWQFYLRHQI